ncbi:MAG: IS1595 family transposase [Alphaproteobacteria bacterium]|nr:IS1595 family transposase [Alphaproteobacteria bacterium]
MTQHFLLSAAARTLSLREIYMAGERKAYDVFKSMRWENGEPVCPRCGCYEAYKITTRRKFKCKACYHQFSVTSGTIFSSRKMDFTDLLAAICIFVNAAKGVSALQLSRDLDCQYKTAFVVAHKLREAMKNEKDTSPLNGDVEIDGAYFGGHIRPTNLEVDRIDRRLAKHQTGTRRVVVAIRQRKGRTLPFVVMGEHEGVELAKRYVDRQAIMHADEASHWDARWQVGRINHSEGYSINGICTNQVESYFSRLRRMVRGQHHHVSPHYLHQYANHAAWLENNSRKSNGSNAIRIVAGAMASAVSRTWAGYWQRAAA